MNRRFIWVSAISFMMLSLLALAQPSSAALTFVNGMVTDQIGNPLEEVNVTVEIYDSGMVLKDTRYVDATDEEGSYSVIFGGVPFYEPVVGDTIKVIAKYLSESPVYETTVVEAEVYIYCVDVTIESVLIPEFGLGQNFGLPLAIMGVVAIFVVMARRRAR